MKLLKYLCLSYCTCLIFTCCAKSSEDGLGNEGGTLTNEHKPPDSGQDSQSDSTSIEDLGLRMNSLESDVKSLNVAIENLSSLTSDNGLINSRIRKVENTLKIVCLSIEILFPVCLVLIVVLIVLIINYSKYRKRNHIHHVDIGKNIRELSCKITDLEKKMKSTSQNTFNRSSSSQSYSQTNSDRPNRYQSLSEKGADSVGNGTNKTPPDSNYPATSATSSANDSISYNASSRENEEKGYFGVVVDDDPCYFKKLLNTKDDEARFVANIRGDEAEFEPCDIQMVKSYDYMSSVIDIQGTKTRSDAEAMTVIKRGVAKKQGDIWIITKKAMIALN